MPLCCTDLGLGLSVLSSYSIGSFLVVQRSLIDLGRQVTIDKDDVRAILKDQGIGYWKQEN